MTFVMMAYKLLLPIGWQALLDLSGRMYSLSYFRNLFAAGCVLAAMASPAGATIVSGDVTAVIGGSSTIDTYGYFGSAGADLTGDSVSVSYSFDTSHAYNYTIQNSSTDDYAFHAGGSGSRFVTVSITIGAATLSIANNGATGGGFIEAVDLSGGESLVDYGANNGVMNVEFSNSEAVTYVQGTTLLQPVVPDYAAASIFVQPDTGNGIELLTLAAPAAAVPEPGSLIVLGAAMAGLGAARGFRRL